MEVKVSKAVIITIIAVVCVFCAWTLDAFHF